MAFNEKYEDMQHKGNVLATQALEKLQNGDIQGFETDWKEANKHFDLFLDYVNSEAGKQQMMYGESLNFGIIMDVILENSDKLYQGDKKQRNAFKKIVSTIKNDKVLKEQFDLYNRLTNKNLWEGYDVNKSNDYVNTVTSMTENFNEKQIIEHNKKLIDLIKAGGLNENVLISDENMKLYESIETIMFKKNDMNAINELTEAKDNISSYISEHLISEAKSDCDNDFNSKLAEISEKYEKELTDDEKQLIEDVEKSTNKEKMFNDYKSKTLNMLSENLLKFEGEDKSELQMVIEKVNKKSFNEKTLLVDLSEMIEIMNVMSN